MAMGWLVIKILFANLAPSKEMVVQMQSVKDGRRTCALHRSIRSPSGCYKSIKPTFEEISLSKSHVLINTAVCCRLFVAENTCTKLKLLQHWHWRHWHWYLTAIDRLSWAWRWFNRSYKFNLLSGLTLFYSHSDYVVQLTCKQNYTQKHI